MSITPINLVEVMELSKIIDDFRRIAFDFEIVGGMKRVGASSKDLDLSTEFHGDELPKDIWRLAQKWNEVMETNYGICLDLFVHCPKHHCTIQIIGNTVSMQKLYHNRLDPETVIVDANGNVDDKK